jgi:hypothetical protein
VDAVSSPIQYYPQVLQRSVANAESLLDEYLADPLPVVRAIADTRNQSFKEVVDAAVALDPVAFTHAVVATVGRPAASAARVLGSGEPFTTAGSLLVRLTVPAVSGVLAAGTALADVAQAGSDLDVVHGVSALINVPGRVADGVLNGQVDGQHEQYFGLLGKVVEAPVSEDISGPADYLIRSLQGIGDTISSPGRESVPAAASATTSDVTATIADDSKPGADSAAEPRQASGTTATEPASTGGAEAAEDAPTSESAEPTKAPKAAKPSTKAQSSKPARTPKRHGTSDSKSATGDSASSDAAAG